ncbi:hypothetical protein GCM10009655_04350 [Rhodoglobus aureus]|uniref:Uncharacterized protein n=1 Tax=Rhodoglobus aureus TaxID=191497 RepID=A0ABP4FZW6_9MICO
MLTRRYCGPEDRRLLRHRDSNVNHLNLFIREQFLKVGVHAWDSVAGRDIAGAIQVDIGDPNHLKAGEPVGGQVLTIDDATGTDHGDRQLVFLGHP